MCVICWHVVDVRPRHASTCCVSTCCALSLSLSCTVRHCMVVATHVLSSLSLSMCRALAWRRCRVSCVDVVVIVVAAWWWPRRCVVVATLSTLPSLCGGSHVVVVVVTVALWWWQQQQQRDVCGRAMHIPLSLRGGGHIVVAVTVAFVVAAWWQWPHCCHCLRRHCMVVTTMSMTCHRGTGHAHLNITLTSRRHRDAMALAICVMSLSSCCVWPSRASLL